MVDVEGGASTLIATPAGQGILIDTGWPSGAGAPDAAAHPDRDAKRIEAAMHGLGLHQLDYVIITHFHIDHIGGLGALAQAVPIGQFLDHGLLPHAVDGTPAALYAAYLKISHGRRQTARPGEVLRFKSVAGQPPLTLTILAAAKNVWRRPGAPDNPLCSSAESQPTDTSDNANSVASLLQFGNFRYFDGGDLTWNIEASLVCPKDEVGPVSIYQVDHHGLAISNNPVLLRTLRPLAALENNGPHKGGMAATFAHLRAVLPERDVYQLHLNLDTSAQDNAAPANIANPDTSDPGNGFRVVVASDGQSFRILNERTGQAREYHVGDGD